MNDNILREGDNLDNKIDTDTEAKLYKCPNCGSFLAFDPQEQKMKCSHCDSLFEMAQKSAAIEVTYTSDSEFTYEVWKDKAVKCEACGATSVLPTYETATQCPFCGGHLVLDLDACEGLKPNAVLPFKQDKQQADALYKKWVRKNWFVNTKFKKSLLHNDIKGVYVPLFTFDTNTYSTYTIKYGVYYYTIVGSGKNRRSVRRTKWYHDSSDIRWDFNDLQVEASNYVTPKTLNKLGGFDTNNSLKYHSQYIAGFGAERYSKSLDNSWEEAKQTAAATITNQIKARYKADVIDYVNVNTNYNNITYKYVLVPIWQIQYAYNKKKYGCVVNGRNGRVTGKAPLSITKIGAVVVLGIAALVGLAYLIMHLL